VSSECECQHVCIWVTPHDASTPCVLLHSVGSTLVYACTSPVLLKQHRQVLQADV
jgi:hypothetical protein